MRIEFEKRTLTKRVPLAISRGTSTGSENLFLRVECAPGIEGLGECAPSTGVSASFHEDIERLLRDFVQGLELTAPHAVYDAARQAGIPGVALAGLDMALWDGLAKRAALPLYALLGFEKPKIATSVTIGLMPPERSAERARELMAQYPQCALKIKLGSPEGLDFDRAHFSAVYELARVQGVKLRVDANGGWDLAAAESMLPWLAAREVEFVEQPLARGDEGALRALYAKRPLPIFIDESCQWPEDVLRFADRVDGVCLKLMKCGGVTGALRIIALARAQGLELMIGCMGESSVAISAGAALSGALDFTDLDSHLNLNPDPARGVTLRAGIVEPPEQAGHGASLGASIPEGKPHP